MGSQATQGALWGQRPDDWAGIQEQTGYSAYVYVLDKIALNSSVKLLDIGCGSGLFASLAAEKGANVTGVDATEALIARAEIRVPSASFSVGEMEELPFEDASFDVVSGFNSFQYAADTKNALSEAKRVLKPGGKLVAMIWGNKEDCEAATYLKAVGSLLPLPPPGAPGPFALTENKALENVLSDIGFKNIDSVDVPSVWDYPTHDIALRGLLSAGPAVRAIEHSGIDKVSETISAAMEPYVKGNGNVVYHNKFRIVFAEK